MYWCVMQGTVFLFCPLTPRGREWIDEHVQSDSQWFGNALVVENRYAWGLAEGMKDEGLLLAELLRRGVTEGAPVCGFPAI
jgi:hypothetical protein